MKSVLTICAALLGASVATGVPAAEAPPAPAAQLRGSISYGRNAPAVGAVVVLRLEGARSPIRAATTGADGAFAFDRLADGAYRVDVRRNGCVPIVKAGIPVKAPFRAVVELVVERGGAEVYVPAPAPHATARPEADSRDSEVTGTVHLPTGAAVPDAKIRMTRLDGGDDPRVALTGTDGSFAIRGLASGGWRVEVLGAGLLPLRTTVDVAAALTLEAQLAPQPADYEPSPEDLIFPEAAIPPKAN